MLVIGYRYDGMIQTPGYGGDSTYDLSADQVPPFCLCVLVVHATTNSNDLLLPLFCIPGVILHGSISISIITETINDNRRGKVNHSSFYCSTLLLSTGIDSSFCYCTAVYRRRQQRLLV